MAIIKINTGNYGGETAVITYYPCTGGTINIGTVVMPYYYDTNYYLGTYSVYFSNLDKTCYAEVACPTPTPTATPTNTPTLTKTPILVTPTNTPTLQQIP